MVTNPPLARTQLLRIGATLLLLAVVVSAVLWVDRLAERRAVDAERARLAGIAGLASSAYQRQVEKFQLVATTLSADPDVADLIDARTPTAEGRLNRRLADLTAALDASVIYLLDDRGLTIASSNWRQPDSFLGENYGFRAYFRQAMAQGQWAQFALGTRSRVPGLFVARRVSTGSGKQGVIVVKIRFDRLEADWTKSPGLAFVASEQGVILVTSRPEWRFETTGTLSALDRQRLTEQVEYGNAPLRQNALYASGSVVTEGADYRRTTRFVAVSEPLPNGWSVNLLAPVSEAVVAARFSGRLMLALIVAAIAALVTGYIMRARAIVARQQRENDQRIGELKERLEQANKLSTLGQIAAGVGHEINQPLTAIGLRAQTAQRLMGKGRLDEAAAALEEIGALTTRAGAITGELRLFARRSNRRLGQVVLGRVFAGVELLLGDRIRKCRVELTLTGSDIAVTGEQGRLEQVLVNLVQNALDAIVMDGAITIAATSAQDLVTICITDTGSGIPKELQARLFQPFNTSKDAGLGLGLVICRDILTDMGGELHLAESERGACFVVTLRSAA